MLKARAAARWDRVPERLMWLVTNVGLHRRLLTIRSSGVLHAMIFSGFIVLFTAIVQSFGAGLFPEFSLAPIGGETWIALLQEIFALLIIAALGLAAYQRFVIKPARFRGSNRTDATIIYLLVRGVAATWPLEFSFV